MPSRRTPWCRDGPNPPQCPRCKFSRRQVWRRELARLLERKYSIIFLHKFISNFLTPEFFLLYFVSGVGEGQTVSDDHLVRGHQARPHQRPVSHSAVLEMTVMVWLWSTDFMGVYSAESVRGSGRHYKAFFSGILGRIRNFGWYFVYFRGFLGKFWL